MYEISLRYVRYVNFGVFFYCYPNNIDKQTL